MATSDSELPEAITTHRQDLILAEQVRGLYASTPAIAGGALVLPPTIVALFWDYMHHDRALLWVAMVMATAGLWAVLLNRRFERNGDLPRDSRYWLAQSLVRSLLSGLSWGMFFIADATQSELTQVLGGAALIGLGSITVTTLSFHRLAYAVFSTSMFTPYIVGSFAIGTPTSVWMAVLATLSLGYTQVASRNFCRAIVGALEKRFENEELVRRLELQRAELESARHSAEVARETERALREQADQARQRAVDANLAKSRFLAAASHDLRQPMHALGLFAAALREQVNDESAAGIVKKIEMSVASTEMMFNGILDVSRLDAGILAPELRAFDLHPLLERLGSEYAPLAHAKQLTLRLRSRSATVYSDPALVERVLRNLLSNALRYTHRGGVLLAARRRRGEISIQVFDTGIGIPEDMRSAIFREFFQLPDSRKTDASGLGLGLSIVQRIGSMLETEVRVRSRMGRGSMFEICLPISATRLIDDDTQHSNGGDDQALVGALVLAIDDDANVLDALETLLRQWGCRVLVATSLAEARGLLDATEDLPDLLLSDFRLADGETGVDAIRQIHDQWGRIPAALITGDTAPERLLDATASDFELLHKPLNPGVLQHALRRLLMQPRHEAQNGDRRDDAG